MDFVFTIEMFMILKFVYIAKQIVIAQMFPKPKTFLCRNNKHGSNIILK